MDELFSAREIWAGIVIVTVGIWFIIYGENIKRGGRDNLPWSDRFALWARRKRGYSELELSFIEEEMLEPGRMRREARMFILIGWVFLGGFLAGLIWKLFFY